ncbi:hypothetical protein N665_3191s0002 [Sinapis alba]|nr:hypothetical protein N665_3191s0002 [Sinapis alba]
MDHISDIKLIRTDTTLDLSQKAEKGHSTYAEDDLYGAYDAKSCFFIQAVFLLLGIVVELTQLMGFTGATGVRLRKLSLIVPFKLGAPK